MPQPEWTAVRALISTTLLHAQGQTASQYPLSFAAAVQKFDEAMNAWEQAKTPAAAVAVATLAILSIMVPPFTGGLPQRPSQAFRDGMDRIVAGLTRLMAETA